MLKVIRLSDKACVNVQQDVIGNCHAAVALSDRIHVHGPCVVIIKKGK